MSGLMVTSLPIDAFMSREYCALFLFQRPRDIRVHPQQQPVAVEVRPIFFTSLRIS